MGGLRALTGWMQMLEHDPEKACPGLDPGPVPDLIRDGWRFSLGTNAKRLPGDHAQIKEIERDDDSKKSHPALETRKKCLPFGG